MHAGSWLWCAAQQMEGHDVAQVAYRPHACILTQTVRGCALRRRDHDAAEQRMRNTRALKEGASDDLTTLAKQVPASLRCMLCPAVWHHTLLHS